jgi:hypothetical protein
MVEELNGMSVQRELVAILYIHNCNEWTEAWRIRDAFMPQICVQMQGEPNHSARRLAIWKKKSDYAKNTLLKKNWRVFESRRRAIVLTKETYKASNSSSPAKSNRKMIKSLM